MMAEEELSFIDKTVISEESFGKILQDLNQGHLSFVNGLELLKNQNILRFFKYNTVQYCELHSTLLKNIENPNTFLDFLKNENTFQKIIIERNEFSVNFLNVSLMPLITTSEKFSTHEDVFEETSKVIQRCIFSKKFKEFETYFNEQMEKKKSSKHESCKALFKFMTTLLYHTENSVFGYKLIVNSFVRAFNNFSLTYKMLVILTESIGFDIKTEFNLNKVACPNEVSLDKSLAILNEILGIINNFKVDLDYKLNDVTFTNFIKKLLQSIIALTKSPNSCCYQICLKVAETDPLIVESLINELLSYIMLSDNNNCILEYEQMMVKIFEIFNKLHRIHNLISKMVSSLKVAMGKSEDNSPIYEFKGSLSLTLSSNLEYYNISKMLPQTVLEYFTECITNLASWQIINLFKTLLFHLGKSVDEIPSLKEDKQFHYIEILSTLICQLLLSVRMAEHTVADSTVEKFIGGLAELRAVLSRFGVAILHKEHNHILIRTFLSICYHWAEIYITLEYYSVTNSVKMEKTVDNNLISPDLTYLHSYLSSNEWCLISQRITNFGEKECKEMMQKLVMQKLKAIVLFENDNNKEDMVKKIVTDFETNSIEILSDRFILSNVLDKMPSTVILSLSETIFKRLLDNSLTKPQENNIYDSELLTKGIFTVIFSKINKLLKTKRKHDQSIVKKACTSKIISTLPPVLLLTSNLDSHIEKAAVLLVNEEENYNGDLKLHSDKIRLFLDILSKLPIIFCEENCQKLSVLLILSLHKDLCESNCDGVVKRNVESLIIGFAQHKFNFFSLLDASTFLTMLIKNFERSEELFYCIAHNIFKSDASIQQFRSGMEYVIDNVKNYTCLRFGIVILNCLAKLRKNKISAESRELCQRYKYTICKKITKTIYKKKPEDNVIEAYALALKTFIAKDEDDCLSKLKICLDDYIEFALANLNDATLKGSLLLFSTVLHNKSSLPDSNDELILRIWNSLKGITIKSEILDEYSQIIMLIASLIPSEQLSKVFSDLLSVTENSIGENGEEFSKHLKTWTSILSTNFNPAKTKILREQLELLLEKLILMMDRVEYQEDLFSEVIQFEISIIQSNHVPLTSAIVDFFLLTVSIATMKKTSNFCHVFNLCSQLMESLLKHRNPLVMDRLPPYLLQYRILLKFLCANSSSNLSLKQNQVQKISDCAHRLEKLTKSLVECAKDMGRISMYLIADILAQYEVDTLNQNVKKHLDNCLYSLISLCDQHAVQYLMRVLSNASTEIFKIMYENYKKYYRFTGKV